MNRGVNTTKTAALEGFSRDIAIAASLAASTFLTYWPRESGTKVEISWKGVCYLTVYGRLLLRVYILLLFENIEDFWGSGSEYLNSALYFSEQIVVPGTVGFRVGSAADP